MGLPLIVINASIIFSLNFFLLQLTAGVHLLRGALVFLNLGVIIIKILTTTSRMLTDFSSESRQKQFPRFAADHLDTPRHAESPDEHIPVAMTPDLDDSDFEEKQEKRRVISDRPVIGIVNSPVRQEGVVDDLPMAACMKDDLSRSDMVHLDVIDVDGESSASDVSLEIVMNVIDVDNTGNANVEFPE